MQPLEHKPERRRVIAAAGGVTGLGMGLAPAKPGILGTALHKLAVQRLAPAEIFIMPAAISVATPAVISLKSERTVIVCIQIVLLSGLMLRASAAL